MKNEMRGPVALMLITALALLLLSAFYGPDAFLGSAIAAGVTVAVCAVMLWAGAPPKC